MNGLAFIGHCSILMVLKGKRNPYLSLLKQRITIRLDKETVTYFKQLVTELGMPNKT